ncbi:MAG: ABC transporter ATP-binding protein [Solirubrobacterales bacterium]|nr:ABC transporter ATP-binding protein [Solirubrobacterales bacterium]
MATRTFIEQAVEDELHRGEVAAKSGRDDQPVVIEVRDLDKSFRIPSHRIDTFKERMVHPFSAIEYRELKALQKVSFDIHDGEFFGIVGRNGSGKSTLLKILASIYRADAGTIRMAGRLAPFIELGVGFSADLAARDNVILNGVMMGLSRKEARTRVDAVLDFAELRDFADLKLKNYSSGMTVRLAFSVMLQSDADILLVDEVLAVGDAAFQQKCADVFHDMRDAGRTIVLVTHDMAAVEGYCHRAMLIHDGEVRYVGDPEEVGRRYLRLNFEKASEPQEGAERAGVPDRHARIVDAWLENEDSQRAVNVEQGKPIHLHAVIEARQELRKPTLGFHCVNADGIHVFGFNHVPARDGREVESIAAGERLRVSAAIDNPLSPGRYTLSCWVVRDREMGDLALQSLDLLDFVVFGTDRTPGMVAVDVDVDVEFDLSGPRTS